MGKWTGNGKGTKRKRMRSTLYSHTFANFFCSFIPRSDLIEKHQLCVRVLGDVALLPHDVQVALAKAVHISRNHKRCLNEWICDNSFHALSSLLCFLSLHKGGTECMFCVHLEARNFSCVVSHQRGRAERSTSRERCERAVNRRMLVFPLFSTARPTDTHVGRGSSE